MGDDDTQLVDDASAGSVFRGRILAAWREQAGMTQAALAHRLGLTDKAVHHWESGRGIKRAATVGTVERAAMALGAGPALVDMWYGVGTFAALPAHVLWRHNFPRKGEPAWAWIRMPQGRSGRAHLWWGEPFQGHADLGALPEGLIVTFPVSVPNPGLEVTLPEPAWVVFGHGDIPEPVANRLGVQLVDARTLHEPVRSDYGAIKGPLLTALTAMVSVLRLETLAESYRIRWNLIQPHLPLMRPATSDVALDGLELAPPTEPTDPLIVEWSSPQTQVHLDGSALRRLRDARGMGVEEAARLVTALDTANPLSYKQLRNLEGGQRPPDVTHLVPRLDTVYGAEGRLGVSVVLADEPAPSTAHPRTGMAEPAALAIRYPPYWRGPVWLRLAATPGDHATIALRWGPWTRRQTVRSGTVLTTNKTFSTDPSKVEHPGEKNIPLLVRAPKGWSISAGTGAVPTALDINHNWRPADWQAAFQILGEGAAAAVAAKGRSGHRRK